jgi:hypothetical protein
MAPATSMKTYVAQNQVLSGTGVHGKSLERMSATDKVNVCTTELKLLTSTTIAKPLIRTTVYHCWVVFRIPGLG